MRLSVPYRQVTICYGRTLVGSGGPARRPNRFKLSNKFETPARRVHNDESSFPDRPRVFGGFFLYNGINHFTQRKALAKHAGSKNVPIPDAAVLASGVALVIGGASILAGVKPKYGGRQQLPVSWPACHP